MSEPEGRAKSIADGHKTSAGWYLMPAAVLLLGFVAVTLYSLARHLDVRHRVNSALADAIMELEIQTATAHLWLEEALSQDVHMNRAMVRSNFAEAERIWKAVLHGGETQHGLSLPPLRDRAHLVQADKITALLGEFEALAEKRFASPTTSGIGSKMDAQFDRIFIELQGACKRLEDDVEQNVVDGYVLSKRLFLAFNFMWMCIVAAATLLLWRFAERKKSAEMALQTVNEGLEEKVAERTEALKGVNEQLSIELAGRIRSEEALRVSESKFRGLSEQFQSLLAAIPDSITLLSPELRILWANNGAALAAKGEQVAGRNCFEVWHHASAPCKDCSVQKCYKTGKVETALFTQADGRIWDLKAVPLPDDKGRVANVIEIASDVTEKTTLRREAERAAHLASLGELAAGVAHEINNPVNGIINYAEILVNKNSEESREHELGRRIIREGERIAFIVKSLLSFARADDDDKSFVRVRPMLDDVLSLTMPQMKKEGVSIETDIAEDAPAVYAQPQKIEQVFLNIINNARDALNEKYPGKHESKIIRVSARATTADGRQYLRVVFRDRGTGVPADLMARLKDPFFSTKPRGKGTGLGLSISHGIVANHGGRLEIDSVEGEYTEVAVVLPVGGMHG